MNQFQPNGAWPLPPIRSAQDSESLANLAMMKPTPTLASTSPLQSHRTLSVSDASTTSPKETQTSSGLPPRRAKTQEIGSTSEEGPSPPADGSFSQEEHDPFAQRISLLPEDGPCIPPIYEAGQKVEVKQKQNSGRRMASRDPAEADVSDPNKRRMLTRQTEHTIAERFRRNNHKNLLKDLELQTPARFLEESGWDKSKAPDKKQILEASVRYMLDMSQKFTSLLHEKANMDEQSAQIRHSYEALLEEREKERDGYRKASREDQRAHFIARQSWSSIQCDLVTRRVCNA